MKRPIWLLLHISNAMNNWLNVYVNCFLNQWFCYRIPKSCCYLEISNNFIALGLSLPMLPVRSFYPNFSSSSLDLSTTHSGDQWVLNFGLSLTPGELVEMHIFAPQILIWQAGNLCCWQVSQRLGLGSLCKALAKVDALWDTRVQTLRTMASSQRISTLCFFAGGLPSSPTHLEWILLGLLQPAFLLWVTSSANKGPAGTQKFLTSPSPNIHSAARSFQSLFLPLPL